MTHIVRKAIYAGTFDPLTNGHLWMIHEAARLFDHLVVAIGVNPDKKFLFTREERIEIIKETVADFPNVSVEEIDNQFLVEYAHNRSIEYFVRGMRNPADYEYERVMRQINADIDARVHTVFLIPPRELCDISSTVIKGLVGPSGWTRVVERYVPHATFKRLFFKHFPILETIKRNATRPFDLKRIADDFMAAYLDKGRAYHNIHHIASMFEDFAQYRDHLHDPDAVEIAIGEHDIVYNTKHDENEKTSEELSAEHAYLLATRAGFPQDFASKIDRMIMATQHLTVPTDPDERFLVDADLSILGKELAEFDAYERGIRSEYAWVEEKFFRTKRAEILELLLNRVPMYHTSMMREKYEERAKRNLVRSIKALRGE
jgi:pantetheine-phosphate adenylyltransferase